LIKPLDTAGLPDEDGKIIFLSLGMSNCNQIFDVWEVLDSNRRSNVQLINGAIGGTAASEMDEDYFDAVEGLITTAGGNVNQVQAIWLYTAEPYEDRAFDTHVNALETSMKNALLIAVERFPNVQQVLVSSREYAGYADLLNTPSPEPWAYEGAFAVKSLIESQIYHATTGDPTLAYSSFPWIGWAAYTWADGEAGRLYDDLIYVCEDFQPADGTHPNTGAKNKIVALLEAAFTTDEIMSQWYVGLMPVVPLGSTADNTNATSYETDAVFLPAPGEPVFAYVASRITGTSPGIPELTGNNIDWEMVETETYQTLATERSRITLFTGMSTNPTETVLVADFGAVTQSACHISAFQVFNTKVANYVVQALPNALDTTATLPFALAAPGHEDNLAIIGVSTVSGNITFESGMESIHTLSSSGDIFRLRTGYSRIFYTPITASMTSGTQHMGGIAVEVAKFQEPVPMMVVGSSYRISIGFGVGL
jgi:hypothetical protein